MIHESADVARAEQYWADVVNIDVSTLQRTTRKRHNPKTVRKNTGKDYHGCLVIQVNRSAELYCRVEGWWSGIVVAAQERTT